MRCQVELYVAGTTFYEEMEAVDYQQARRIALARNPGATVVSVNAVFDQPDYETSWTEGSSDTYSSSSSSSSDASGIFALCVLGGGCWLAYEAWKLGSAIVISAWQWIVGAAQWAWGLFSWIPFMSPQLLVGLVFGFFFFILILGALDD
tara:strand:+ start:52 stop:498 length:447 start_codon:yes stop_codon:yes gene_type:complete